MKKILLLLAICFTANAYAQKTADEVTEVNFYGVDFSKAHVIGTKETPDQFRAAMNGMNILFLAEPKKYDAQRAVGVAIDQIDITTANERIAGINDNVFYGNKSVKLTEEDFATVASAYKSNSGKTGVVIVADELNKLSNHGYFVLVMFSEDSGRVIATKKVSGKAGGFGLRNFWARAVLESMNSAKLTSWKNN